MLRNPHRQPAVDGDGFAGDVVVGDHFADEGGDLLAVPSRCRGMRLSRLFLRMLGHGGVERGADHAGGDDVDADVVVGKVAGHGAGHLREAPLTVW